MMNDIRIYDYEFNLLHIEPDIMSAYWILNFNDIGTFEGTFPLTSGICDVVMKNKYLILVQGKLQALITAYLADTKLTVFGKSVNWILSRRTFPAFKTSELLSQGKISNSNPGTVMTYIVKKAFSDVSNFEVFDLSGNTETADFERTTRSAVSDIAKEYLGNNSLGHRVRLDIINKKWIFEVYAGTALPLTISEENRNMTEVSVSDDAQEFFSSAWYAKELEDLGDWDASSPLPSASSSNYGKYYRITNTEENGRYPNGSYLVCVDTSGQWKVCSELPTLEEEIAGTLSGIYKWDTFLSASTKAEAKTALSEKKWSHNLKGTASHLYYKKDYELGDTLRVQVNKGTFFESTEKIIFGVDLWWENGNIGEKIKFKEDENGI